ncbi:MAG: hypothetical protein DCC64_15830 [Planctomycetota bacterium]|nr:MAG: hypothetical protein DCC64_15830 [Planctomycetota bacterium]
MIPGPPQMFARSLQCTVSFGESLEQLVDERLIVQLHRDRGKKNQAARGGSVFGLPRHNKTKTAIGIENEGRLIRTQNRTVIA